MDYNPIRQWKCFVLLMHVLFGFEYILVNDKSEDITAHDEFLRNVL